MSKRIKNTAKRSDARQTLRRALAKRTKDELMNLLIELASEDRQVLRRLAGRIELNASINEFVAATRLAIADAKDFDKRDINRISTMTTRPTPKLSEICNV